MCGNVPEIDKGSWFCTNAVLAWRFMLFFTSWLAEDGLHKRRGKTSASGSAMNGLSQVPVFNSATTPSSAKVSFLASGRLSTQLAVGIGLKYPE
jgi:hypothetical protein